MNGLIPFNKTNHRYENNHVYYKNIVSPFSNRVDEIKTSNGELLIDKYYGLVFNQELVVNPYSVYGNQNLMPEFSGDRLENYGYLRVPFRKIPRWLINSQKDLEMFSARIDSREPHLKILFRGQTQEFTVPRGPEERLNLFGDAQCLEPSLVPSAVRNGMALEEISPLWNCLLQSYLDSNLSIIKKSKRKYIKDEYKAFKTSPNFPVFSLSLAQHYGLPSYGLDVTTNLRTALFFATHKFEKYDNGSWRYRNVLRELKAPPVIYILAPADRFHLNYSDFKPKGVNFLRPDKQDARFIQNGWGLSQNKNARSIWMAIYLKQDGDFSDIPTPKDLFPQDDPFYNHVRRNMSGISKEIIDKYFSNFYFVTDN